MPGFYANVYDIPIGDYLANTNVKFVYNYTWQVNALFEEVPTSSSPLIYLKDASLPSVTIQKEQVTGASLEYKFASSAVYDDVRVTFYDTKGLLEKIRAWRARIWSENNGLRPSNEYKKVSKIACYYPQGDFAEGYTLVGSWPSTIKFGDLTYTSSDVKFIDLTITYDWAEEFIDSQKVNFDQNIGFD